MKKIYGCIIFIILIGIIASLIIARPQKVDKLDGKDRGGFGSTGVK